MLSKLGIKRDLLIENSECRSVLKGKVSAALCLTLKWSPDIWCSVCVSLRWEWRLKTVPPLQMISCSKGSVSFVHTGLLDCHCRYVFYIYITAVLELLLLNARQQFPCRFWMYSKRQSDVCVCVSRCRFKDEDCWSSVHLLGDSVCCPETESNPETRVGLQEWRLAVK